MVRLRIFAWLGVLAVAPWLCANPATARTTGCDEVVAARTGGMSIDETKAALQTTTGKVLACDQLAVIRERIAAHRYLADAHREMLHQRFAP